MERQVGRPVALRLSAEAAVSRTEVTVLRRSACASSAGVAALAEVAVSAAVWVAQSASAAQSVSASE